MRERQRVDAEVQQRAAAELRCAHPVPGRERAGHPEVRRDVPQFADRPVGHQLDDAPDRGVGPHPHRLHQEDPTGTGQADQILGGGHIEGERLLAEHRPAGVQAYRGRGVVCRVRSGDIDDVNLRVLGELLP